MGDRRASLSHRVLEFGNGDSAPLPDTSVSPAGVSPRPSKGAVPNAMPAPAHTATQKVDLNNERVVVPTGGNARGISNLKGVHVSSVGQRIRSTGIAQSLIAPEFEATTDHTNPKAVRARAPPVPSLHLEAVRKVRYSDETSPRHGQSEAANEHAAGHHGPRNGAMAGPPEEDSSFFIDGLIQTVGPVHRPSQGQLPATVSAYLKASQGRYSYTGSFRRMGSRPEGPTAQAMYPSFRVMKAYRDDGGDLACASYEADAAGAWTHRGTTIGLSPRFSSGSTATGSGAHGAGEGKGPAAPTELVGSLVVQPTRVPGRGPPDRPQSAALAAAAAQSTGAAAGGRTAYGRAKAESTPNFRSPRWNSSATAGAEKPYKAVATFSSRTSSRQGAFTSQGFSIESSVASADIPIPEPPPASTHGLLSDATLKHNMFPSTRGSAGFASRSPRQLPHEQQPAGTHSIGYSSVDLDRSAWRRPSKPVGGMVSKSPRQVWAGHHSAFVNPRPRAPIWNWRNAPTAADESIVGPGRYEQCRWPAAECNRQPTATTRNTAAGGFNSRFYKGSGGWRRYPRQSATHSDGAVPRRSNSSSMGHDSKRADIASAGSAVGQVKVMTSTAQPESGGSQS